MTHFMVRSTPLFGEHRSPFFENVRLCHSTHNRIISYLENTLFASNLILGKGHALMNHIRPFYRYIY